MSCNICTTSPFEAKSNTHPWDGWTNVLKAFHIFHVGFASVNFPHQECGRRKAFIELHALVKIQILLGPTTWWNQREFTVKLQKSFPSGNQHGCLLWNYILFRPGMKLSKQNFCDVKTAGVFFETKSPKPPFLILLLGSTFPNLSDFIHLFPLSCHVRQGLQWKGWWKLQELPFLRRPSGFQLMNWWLRLVVNWAKYSMFWHVYMWYFCFGRGFPRRMNDLSL